MIWVRAFDMPANGLKNEGTGHVPFDSADQLEKYMIIPRDRPPHLSSIWPIEVLLAFFIFFKLKKRVMV
jgi:hypothetical protein